MTTDAATGDRGHRVVPHTADVIVEAWARERVTCLEELVAAVVETFAEIRDTADAHEVVLRVEPGDDADQVTALIEELIYRVDVHGEVPVRARLEAGADGSLGGRLDVVPLGAVEPTGAAPKGASRSELRFEQVDGQWRCRVLLDV